MTIFDMIVVKGDVYSFPLSGRKSQNAKTQDLFLKILCFRSLNMRAVITAFSALLMVGGGDISVQAAQSMKGS
ncbi:hypothetical protein BH18THE2_BH18THE2_04090 [soil metagenome]